mgnify:CR=1 FL=1
MARLNIGCDARALVGPRTGVGTWTEQIVGGLVRTGTVSVVLAATKAVELADEDEFKKAFPDCETGAMPPFGNLYGMNVFVSQALREDDEIAFNAGSHSELIRLPYADYERLVQPTPLAN